MLAGPLLAFFCLEPAAPAPAPPAASPAAPALEPDPGPPPEADLEPPPAFRLGLTAGASLRPGAPGREVPPRWGLAFGFLFGGRYAAVASDRVELGAQVDFSYARHTKDVQGSLPLANGGEQPFDSVRLVAEYAFTLQQTVAARVGRFRPWVGAGGGFSIGYFSSDERAFRPGEARTFRPVARGALGIDVALDREASRPVGLGVRADWLRSFGADGFETNDSPGTEVRPFGDLVLLSLVMQSHF